MKKRITQLIRIYQRDRRLNRKYELQSSKEGKYPEAIEYRCYAQSLEMAINDLQNILKGKDIDE